MTSSDFLVLHTLRCIGFADLARANEATRLPESDVESVLIDLAAAGLVRRIGGAFGGWGLTETGRAVDAEQTADELETTGVRSKVAAAYGDFRPLNSELLDICTAWQTRSVGGAMVLNDHGDAAYDARVLDRLANLDQRVDRVCADLSAALRRFQRYRLRLTDALDRARRGALDYVTDNTASYHIVWFQLHEDLLVTLGIPRH